MGFDELTDNEWAMLAPLFAAEPLVSLSQRGRPRTEPRDVANAILWKIITGKPWTRMPVGYPSLPTCRRRYHEWHTSGMFDEMLQLLSNAGWTFPSRNRSSQPRQVTPRDPRGPDSARFAAPHCVFWSRPVSSKVPSPAADDPGLGQNASRSKGRLWMGLASHGARVADDRGYVIYAGADFVGDEAFRGWAEIMKRGKRMVRSGLIGRPFSDLAAAQQYALDWARLWVERDCRASAASCFGSVQVDLAQRLCIPVQN